MEAQASAPGGAASGLAVELDSEDAMLAEFLVDEGIMGDNNERQEEADEETENEEMQDLLDVLDGLEILADNDAQQM